MIPLNNLTDVFRNKYKELRQYTFNKKQMNDYTRARLDYFLMNESSMDLVKKGGDWKSKSII